MAVVVFVCELFSDLIVVQKKLSSLSTSRARREKTVKAGYAILGIGSTVDRWLHVEETLSCRRFS